MPDSILTLSPDDSVAIALQNLSAGDRVSDTLRCAGDIPAGHKIAVRDIGRGETVQKYGHAIGIASQAIGAGDYVHGHNLEYAPGKKNAVLPEGDARGTHRRSAAASDLPTYRGYRRADGRVGTRNYVGIMATVNCSATVVARIARHFEYSQELAETNIDGVIPVTHRSGCGIPADSDELSMLQRVLRGYLNHPNFCAWLVVGLGCEVNQVSALLEGADGGGTRRIRSVKIQDAGGTTATIDAGVDAVRDLAAGAAELVRTPEPLSTLTLGLQCGGSDAWSGVTANPALGNAVDGLLTMGAAAILSETPEIHGAEELLKNRAVDAAVAARLQRKVDWWHDYLGKHGQDVDGNPSPGNIAGGITTILEKSLGGVAKGGSMPLAGVIDYGERLQGKGLWFMDSPGYDPCSVTGEVAAGANLICFTTGRGSTFGAAGAPTLKLASNRDLYQRMSDDMDIDCGGIAAGETTIETVGGRILQAVLDVASGRRTKSEQHGLGTFEFVPWTPGVVV